MIRVFCSECVFVTRCDFKARLRHLKPVKATPFSPRFTHFQTGVHALPSNPHSRSTLSLSPFSSWLFCDGLSISPGHAPTERPVLTCLLRHSPAPSSCPAQGFVNGKWNTQWIRPNPTKKQNGLRQVCLFLSSPGWVGTGKLLP